MDNLKERVKTCLNQDEQSRNSDIRLVQVMWYNYHRDKLVELPDKTYAVRLRDLFDLPREDHVSRVRRSIQEEAMRKIEKGFMSWKVYLPTSVEVVRQRKMNEANWSRYVGIR